MNTAMTSEYRRLPQDVKPIHYAVSLFDMDLVGDNDWTYQGRVVIELDARNPTERIVLNAHRLRNISASLAGGDKVGVSCISLDEQAQRLIIDLDRKIVVPCPSVYLTLTYDAVIDGHLTGFYRMQADGSSKGQNKADYAFATQFQPSDARRAFPCFDEPDFKATFDLSIEVPGDQIVLSNMPEKSSHSSDRNPRCKIVTFERTPVMSTYLLAWAIGEFKPVEKSIARRRSDASLPIRVYTSPDSLQHAEFALDLAGRVIEYFTQMFGIEYPLPKLDLLAVPEMSDDAMENWGLVIFRSTALLLNEATTEPGVRTRIAYIIAHELAHQWFGNLVTMTWWDELWLNEGFATWAGWDACDFLYPDWDVWGQFVADDMQEAFVLDSLPSSHPVQVPVLDGLEVDAIFDSISYLKGASIIRMVAAYLGRDIFLRGLSEYLSAHTYQNTTADSLWSALKKASGKDVAILVRSWIKSKGFPVVSVKQHANSRMLSLRQFPIGDSSERSLWSIPVLIQTSKGVISHSFETESAEVKLDGDLVKINVEQQGFFRTQDGEDILLKLSDSLSKLSSRDQAGLLGDAMAMAFNGWNTPTSTVLTLLEKVSSTTDFVVWTSIISCLDQISCAFFSDENINDGLESFTRDLIGSRVVSLGWKPRKNESYNTQNLRPLLLSAAGLSEESSVTEEARAIFHAIKRGNKKAVHPFLRQTVFEIAACEMGSEAVTFLQKEYQKTSSPHEREAIAEAMGQVSDEDDAWEGLVSSFSGSMAAQDLRTFAVSMANNPASREVVWAFIQEEWKLVHDRLGGSMALFEPFIRECLQTLTSLKEVEEIERFFGDKDTQGYQRGLTVAMDFIHANAAYRERDMEDVRGWLQARGFYPAANEDDDSDEDEDEDEDEDDGNE